MYYIYIYIFIYREREGEREREREMGGAPKNPAPRNHFLAHRQAAAARMHSVGTKCRRVPTPLRSTSPLSE